MKLAVSAVMKAMMKNLAGAGQVKYVNIFATSSGFPFDVQKVVHFVLFHASMTFQQILFVNVVFGRGCHTDSILMKTLNQ